MPRRTIRFQLDGGTNGSTTARKMSNGSGSLLNYHVPRFGAHPEFRQGTKARLVTLAAAGSGVVGAMAGSRRQAVPAGTYTDTVVVTLDF